MFKHKYFSNKRNAKLWIAQGEPKNHRHKISKITTEEKYD